MRGNCDVIRMDIIRARSIDDLVVNVCQLKNVDFVVLAEDLPPSVPGFSETAAITGLHLYSNRPGRAPTHRIYGFQPHITAPNSHK